MLDFEIYLSISLALLSIIVKGYKLSFKEKFLNSGIFLKTSK